jgi:hypothetical protein
MGKECGPKPVSDETLKKWKFESEKEYAELLKKQKVFEILQTNRLLNARRRVNGALEYSSENTDVKLAIINLIQAVDCMLHFIEDSIKAGHNGYVEE